MSFHIQISLSFDMLFLFHANGPVQKKSPDRNQSIRGFPCFIHKILPLPSVREGHAHPWCAIQAGLLTPLPFQQPSHRRPDAGFMTVAQHAERVPFFFDTQRIREKVTAAGPSRFYGVPY